MGRLIEWTGERRRSLLLHQCRCRCSGAWETVCWDVRFKGDKYARTLLYTYHLLSLGLMMFVLWITKQYWERARLQPRFGSRPARLRKELATRSGIKYILQIQSPTVKLIGGRSKNWSVHCSDHTPLLSATWSTSHPLYLAVECYSAECFGTHTLFY